MLKGSDEIYYSMGKKHYYLELDHLAQAQRYNKIKHHFEANTEANLIEREHLTEKIHSLYGSSPSHP